VSLVSGCASDQKTSATAEEVRDGEALPPAPTAPAQPASADSTTAPTVPESSDAGAPEPTRTQEALTEGQIAKVSELVNTAELEQAKLAQRKAKAPGVKRFADMMLKHHGEALKEQAKLVKKLKLSAADSTTAAALKAKGDDALTKLNEADASSFDSAYVASQIDAHQQVLEVLDAQLIPAASSPEVINALRTARAVVEQHLKEARALR
jgi:putative membrane protein